MVTTKFAMDHPDAMQRNTANKHCKAAVFLSCTNSFQNILWGIPNSVWRSKNKILHRVPLVLSPRSSLPHTILQLPSPSLRLTLSESSHPPQPWPRLPFTHVAPLSPSPPAPSPAILTHFPLLHLFFFLEELSRHSLLKSRHVSA